jgi:hypothetical protein
MQDQQPSGSEEPKPTGAIGAVLGGFASGISATTAAWQKAPIAVKILAFIVIGSGALAASFVTIWKTVAPEKKGVIVSGPVVGQQIGDNNKQDLTLVNNRSGYLAPLVASTEHVNDKWITEIAFPRSPGIWDQTMTTELKLHLSGPYEKSTIVGWAGFMASVTVRNEANKEEASSRGLYFFTTTENSRIRIPSARSA